MYEKTRCAAPARRCRRRRRRRVRPGFILICAVLFGFATMAAAKSERADSKSPQPYQITGQTNVAEHLQLSGRTGTPAQGALQDEEPNDAQPDQTQPETQDPARDIAAPIHEPGRTSIGDTGAGQIPSQIEEPSTPPPALETGSTSGSPQENDWKLILVNPWTPLPADYKVTLKQLNNGHAVDERCYPDLQNMMDDCRAAGLQPVICSSYRAQETQERLCNNKVNKLITQGYSNEDAALEAGKVVAFPGTSEHQLGLAVDIVDINDQNLGENQEKTAVQKWLMENCWRYGFILRYPNDKSEITGIIYEPWHYRYVGQEVAKEINELGICLEELLVVYPK